LKIHIGDLIMAEVLQGCSTDRAFNEVRRTLSAPKPMSIVGQPSTTALHLASAPARARLAGRHSRS
jgi:hypothetical protein